MEATSVTPTTKVAPPEPGRGADISRWSGALFVAIGIPGFVLGSRTSPYLDSSEDYVAAYADGAGSAPLGRLLGLFAVIALVWALARLRLAFPAERAGLAGAVIPIAGVLYAATWIGMIAVAASTYTAVDHADSFGGFEVVPETAFVVDLIADGFVWANLIVSSVMVWGLALAGRRTGSLPGWFTWSGLILAPLLVIGWMLFMVPVVLFLLWFAAVVAIAPVEATTGA